MLKLLLSAFEALSIGFDCAVGGSCLGLPRAPQNPESCRSADSEVVSLRGKFCAFKLLDLLEH